MKTSHRIFPHTLLIILSMMQMLSACSDEPTPAPLPKDTENTILVYMVATNNLGSGGYDRSDIYEMQTAALNGHFGEAGRLLVYHAPYSGKPVLKEIKANKIDTLKIYETTPISVSIERMETVIADTKKYAPAKSYGMVLWSHASGWLEDGVEETSRAGALYSFGSDNNKRMNTTSLAKALDGKGMDFLYFDCCYMGSVESAYELRNCTPWIIASPTEDPVSGMPYNLTLEHLFNHDYPAAAKTTFDFYHQTYTISDCPVSFVVVDTSKLGALAQATRNIYQKASASWPEGYNPQPFSLSPYYYYDLEDYVKTLAGGADTDLFLAWNKANNEAVVYKAAESSIWGQFPLSRFGGLSTFIFESPSSKYFTEKNYSNLSWFTDVASHLLSADSE